MIIQICVFKGIFHVFLQCKEEKLATEYKKLYKIVSVSSNNNFFNHFERLIEEKLASNKHWGGKQLDKIGEVNNIGGASAPPRPPMCPPLWLIRSQKNEKNSKLFEKN